MAGRRSPVTEIREILRRLQLGERARRIARDLEVSRNTVAHYRRWAAKHGLLTGPLPEPAALAALLAAPPVERPAQEQSLVFKLLSNGHGAKGWVNVTMSPRERSAMGL